MFICLDSDRVCDWQIGTGLVRSVITSKEHSKLDVIPVDMTANAVIAAGWYTAVNKLVFSSTSWVQLLCMLDEHISKPFMHSLWSSVKCTSSGNVSCVHCMRSSRLCFHRWLLCPGISLNMTHMVGYVTNVRQFEYLTPPESNRLWLL